MLPCMNTIKLEMRIILPSSVTLTHERPVQHIFCSDYTHIIQRRDLINFTMCMSQYSTNTTSPKQRN